MHNPTVKGDGAIEGLVLAWVQNDEFPDGTFGTICDDIFFDFENKGSEAQPTHEYICNLICLNLGFSSGEYVHYFDGTDTGYMSLVDNQDNEPKKNACKGDEKFFKECLHLEYTETNCWHKEDIGVRCFEEGYVDLGCKLHRTQQCEIGDIVLHDQ